MKAQGVKSKEFLIEQLEVLLKELRADVPVTSSFVRNHVSAIKDQARCYIDTLPHDPALLFGRFPVPSFMRLPGVGWSSRWSRKLKASQPDA